MDIAKYKLQHRGNVFVLRFPNGTRLHIRHLSYKEYQTFRSLYSSAIPFGLVDSYVATTVVLDSFFTKDWLADPDRLAGYATTVANLVMYLGSDHQEDSLLVDIVSAARQDAMSLDSTMYAVICRVFPGYTFSDLDQLTFPEVVRIFACAEKALMDTGMLEQPFELSVPGQQEEEHKPLVVSEKDVREQHREFGNQANIREVQQADADQARMIKAWRKEHQRDKKQYTPSDVRPELQEYNKAIAQRQQQQRDARRKSRNRSK